MYLGNAIPLNIQGLGHMTLPWNICLLPGKSVDFLSIFILVLSSSWNSLLGSPSPLCLLKSHLSSRTPLKCPLQEAYHLVTLVELSYLYCNWSTYQVLLCKSQNGKRKMYSEGVCQSQSWNRNGSGTDPEYVSTYTCHGEILHSPLEMCTILHPRRTTIYYEILQLECVTHAKTMEPDKKQRTINNFIAKTFTGVYYVQHKCLQIFFKSRAHGMFSFRSLIAFALGPVKSACQC